MEAVCLGENREEEGREERVLIIMREGEGGRWRRIKFLYNKKNKATEESCLSLLFN